MPPETVLGVRALVQLGQQLLPARCSPSWAGELGTGSADTGGDLTCLEGDVSVAGPIKRFNKQPEGSSSALVSYDRGQGLLQSPFQPASGCGSSGFTALLGAFILPVL